jgi:hypothetical protein
MSVSNVGLGLKMRKLIASRGEPFLPKVGAVLTRVTQVPVQSGE